jgi:hypothetical protein
VLAKILADLRDEDGRVLIPGFYEGVPEVPAEQKAQWGTLGFDEKASSAKSGCLSRRARRAVPSWSRFGPALPPR